MGVPQEIRETRAEEGEAKGFDSSRCYAASSFVTHYGFACEVRAEFAYADAGYAYIFFAGLGVGDDVDASAVIVCQ
jgi:hypothetical protein